MIKSQWVDIYLYYYHGGSPLTMTIIYPQLILVVVVIPSVDNLLFSISVIYNAFSLVSDYTIIYIYSLPGFVEISLVPL